MLQGCSRGIRLVVWDADTSKLLALRHNGGDQVSGDIQVSQLDIQSRIEGQGHRETEQGDSQQRCGT